MNLNATTVTLLTKNALTDTTYKLDFETKDQIDFSPGQYLTMQVAEKRRKPYSIVGVKNNVLTLVIDVKPGGIASQYFEALKVGDTTQVWYPMGNFTVTNFDNPKLFVATGTGIAPFISMAHHLINTGFSKEIKVLWGIKTMSDDYLAEFFAEDIKNASNLELYHCISRQKLDQKNVYNGRVTAFLNDWSFETPLTNYDIYISGNKGMVKDVVTILQNKGCKNVFTEMY